MKKKLFFLCFVLFALASCGETTTRGKNNNNKYHKHHWQKHNALESDNGAYVQWDCVYENCNAWKRTTDGKTIVVHDTDNKIVYQSDNF